MKSDTHAFWPNGFLVVADAPGYESEGYNGVYGIDWPLQDFDGFQLQEDLGIPSSRGTIWVATKWDATYQYWRLCTSRNIKARLLLVETEISYPVVRLLPSVIWDLMGYDVAFMTGDFYSAIQQELIGQTASSLRHWKDKLNKHRLFDDADAAYAFLQERLAWIGLDLALETYGDLCVTRVSRFRDRTTATSSEAF